MAAEDDNALLNYDEVVKKQSVTMLQMVNGVAAMGANEPQTRVLRLSEQGWVIPELMDAGELQGAIKSWLKVR